LSPLRKVKNKEMPLRLKDSKNHKVLIINIIIFVKSLCFRAFVAEYYFSEWAQACHCKPKFRINRLIQITQKEFFFKQIISRNRLFFFIRISAFDVNVCISTHQPSLRKSRFVHCQIFYLSLLKISMK